MRDLDTIVAEMFATLSESGSAITDFTPQGVAYTLLRSFASSLQQLELQQEQQATSLDFRLATGVNLDSFTAPFGVTRQPPKQSVGWVLLTATSPLTLPLGSVFTELNSSTQYVTVNNTLLEIPAQTETAVAIQATGIGVEYDLVAGTPLYSTNSAIGAAIVGYERKYDGTACGDLHGGARAESDRSLRSRWYSLLKAGGTLTIGALRSLVIQHPQVIDALVTTPQAGIVLVTIATTSAEPTVVTDVQALVSNYLIGTIVKVQLANIRPLTIEIAITPTQDADLNQIKLDVEAGVTEYIQSARATHYFSPLELESQLSTLGKRVVVQTPVENLSWASNVFIELGVLYVNFRL